jgi:hypothetical protein
MGRWAAANATDGIVPTALCLRVDDIEPVAETLGEEPLAMSRRLPDGSTLSWRLAGLTDMLTSSRLPFFIEWVSGRHPGATPVRHPAGVAAITRVEIGDPADRGPLVHDVEGISVVTGRGVRRVEIETGRGAITLG